MPLKLFFNIKLNKEFKLFRDFPDFLSSKAPKILNSKCADINLIKCGAVWKTTSKSRNKLLIKWINKYISNSKKKLTILELGASSGISVFPGLKKKYKIKKYILTDYKLNYYFKDSSLCKLLFLNKNSFVPFMAYNKLLIFYSDNKSLNLIFNFLSNMIRVFFSIITLNVKKTSFNLLDKQTLKYKKKYPLLFKEYDISSAWKGPKINLLIALNLLNRSYFSNKLMKKIVLNIYNILQNDDFIIVGENKINNRISVYKKIKNKFVLIKNIGGEVDSHNFFLNFPYKIK